MGYRAGSRTQCPHARRMCRGGTQGHHVQTSLLEARQLAGHRQLFSEFSHAMQAALDPRSFFIAKQLEQQQRHGRYQDVTYNLEPNLKESPGGLRDLQNIFGLAVLRDWETPGRILPGGDSLLNGKRVLCNVIKPSFKTFVSGCTISLKGVKTGCCSTIKPPSPKNST